ncbi:double zinc ribbon [bacterium BMS3Abin04]|nr:double zinc ribbon [bacterium BMS3Abin04]
MKCNKCGIENSSENKFCTECGAELKAEADSFYCTHCGAENSKTSNFCVKCGTSLPKKRNNWKNKSVDKNYRNKSKKKQPQKRLILLDKLLENKAVTVIGLVVVGFIVVQFLPNNKTPITHRNRIPNSNTNFVGLAGSRLNDIASKFICSCGTCGELPLETCGCPTATEEKEFIQSQMDAKKSDSQIIKSVNSKYGWIKPQFKYLLSSVGTKSNKSSDERNNEIKLASLLDMQLITEQFKCPCGQCNVEELKDCNCNHPKGAKEVKGFIRDKIKQNTYTVDQIITMVNNTYGGKKI